MLGRCCYGRGCSGRAMVDCQKAHRICVQPCDRTAAASGRKSGKVPLPTDDRGKIIDDGSSSGTFFRFGNCLMPAMGLDATRLVGGSEADRSRVLERLHEYLEANASFDWGQLQDIWSGEPEAVFFNLNGHTYKGREHWTRLWQFYQPNVRSGYWTPFDLGGVYRTISPSSGANGTRSRNGSVGTRPDRHGATAFRSSRARRWCSARKRATGASCTCISRKRARRRVRAASERESGPECRRTFRGSACG